MVECLVRHAEDAEAHAATEREAHASGRAHLPRGGIMLEEAAEASTGNRDGGAQDVDIFSMDSHGNVGGHVAHFFNAVMDGIRGEDARDQHARQDRAPDDGDNSEANAETSEKENGDANAVPRPPPLRPALPLPLPRRFGLAAASASPGIRFGTWWLAWATSSAVCWAG